MHRLLSYTSALLALSMVLFSACNQDDPEDPHNDQELITTVALEFEDTLSGVRQTFHFRDLDGPGGNAPRIDTIRLAPDKVYRLRLDLLDESKNPVESITEEIREEALAHIFLFYPLGGLDISSQYLDQDSQGQPLGLESLVHSAAAGSGQWRIVLKHEADKNNAANTGETDVDISFEARIE